MKRTFLTAILVMAVATAFSQLNWQKGGNNATPPAQPPTLGTDASWNSPLQIITNGIQRMAIRTIL